jgi:hypothetical protein
LDLGLSIFQHRRLFARRQHSRRLPDEQPLGIDDGILYENPNATKGVGQFTELPGSQPGGACVPGCADSEAVVLKWIDGITVNTIAYNTINTVTLASSIDIPNIVGRPI